MTRHSDIVKKKNIHIFVATNFVMSRLNYKIFAVLNFMAQKCTLDLKKIVYYCGHGILDDLSFD
jgi:hypothetical protein